jgi:hypothetical protein
LEPGNLKGWGEEEGILSSGGREGVKMSPRSKNVCVRGVQRRASAKGHFIICSLALTPGTLMVAKLDLNWAELEQKIVRRLFNRPVIFPIKLFPQ